MITDPQWATNEATQDQVSAWSTANIVDFLVAIPWAKEKGEYGVLGTKQEDNGELGKCKEAWLNIIMSNWR